MSLILEALKKLEREKQAPDRGFLVVPHVPWTAKAQGRKLRFAIPALLVLGLASVAYWSWSRGERPNAAPTLRDDPVSGPAPPVTVGPPPLSLSSPPPAPSPARDVVPEVSRPGPAPPPLPPRTTVKSAPAPAASSPASGLELRLNAISQKDGQWVAVLNDRLVREGDEFDGIRVLRIGEAEVEVVIAGRRRIVTF